MRVALVHDDLVQWGGAERVLLGLCEIFPDAPIFTSVYDKDNKVLKNKFGSKKIITSFLQKIPGWKIFYKPLLPLYPLAFEQFDFSEYDLVVSHTTRFAKSIITKQKTKHISYCHTPPRFLWNFSAENRYKWLEILMSKMRLYDQVSTRRVDYFLSGSENAKRRISKVYKRDSVLVYPFVDLDRFKHIEPFDGGYYIIVCRLNKYKRIDVVIDACSNMKFPLKVVGNGPEADRLKIQSQKLKINVDFLQNLNDEMVVEVLAGCKALIIPGVEDFGLIALEAQALGKPVIAYNKGGVLETVIENSTGVLFNEQTPSSLIDAINKLDRLSLEPEACINNAAKFNKENFISNFKKAVKASII